MLRTQELAALHRFDGAEQYFTRAVDFGFSFSIEETFEKWGRDEITEDYVRLIRMIRPDVIFAMSPTGNNGGQHHNASAVLSHDAYKLAGDPTKYPDQLKDGLRPWQPRKFYYSTGFGPGADAAPAPADCASIHRCTIRCSARPTRRSAPKRAACTSARAWRSCWRCRGPRRRTYQLVESTIAGQLQRDERSLVDGVDTSIASLAQVCRAAAAARSSLTVSPRLRPTVQAAQKKFDSDSDDASVAPLVAGLHAVRVLRGQLRGMSIDEAAKYEIEFRLRQKEREFQQALMAASGLRVEALADDGVVVPGQTVKVSVIVANNGASDVAVRQVKFDGFTGDAACALTQVTAGQVSVDAVDTWTGRRRTGGRAWGAATRPFRSAGDLGAEEGCGRRAASRVSRFPPTRA